MADDPTVTPPPEGAPDPSPEDDNPTPDADNPDPSLEDDKAKLATKDKKQQDAAREAQALRKRLRDAETSKDALESRIAALAERAERADLHDALMVAAKTAGVKEAGVVAELVWSKRSDLTFGDDGTVDGLDDVLKGFKAKYPALFFNTPGSADAGAGGKTPDGFDGNALLRRMAGRG